MCLRNTKTAFGTITKLCHWSCVVLVISLIVVGLIMAEIENSPDKLKLYGLHKSGGITVLAIACAWGAWRLLNVRPEYPQSLSKLQQRAATTVKYMLTGFLFAMPLTGWGMSSAAGFPVSVFGMVTLPKLFEVNKPLAGDLRDIHQFLAYALIGVIVMHASAALLHHFHFKDDVLRRMLPNLRKKK